jgi:hypothetical protein
VNLAGLPVLALILFAPWFLVLSGLFLLYPRQPRGAARLRFDLAAIVLSLLAFVASLHWSFDYADRSHGPLWPQVLATSVGYGVFLAVLGIAYRLRPALLRRR